MPLTAAIASRNAACRVAACCRKTSPAAVSRTVRVVRSNRRTPSCASSASTALVTADWETCSSAAAMENRPVRAAAAKYRSWRSVTSLAMCFSHTC